MSLINQMLQELDARRAESCTVSMYGEQVRAVADRRRFHPAWWLVLVLALLLAAICGWIVLQPASEAPSRVLPLKMDLDMEFQPSASPASASNSLAPPSNVALDSTVSVAETAPAPNDLTAQLPTSKQPSELESGGKDTLSAQPVAPKQIDHGEVMERGQRPRLDVSSATVDDIVGLRVSPATAAAARPEPARSAVSIIGTATSPISKQVKELTPQQKAEEEYRKAISAMQLDKHTDAESALRSALRLDFAHVGARQALIGMLIDAGKFDEAIHLAHEGLVIDPQRSDLVMILGRLQAAQGDIKSAIDTLHRHLSEGRERADFQALLAALYQRDQNHKKAIDHFGSAVKLAPQNGIWWMGLGISLKEDGRAAEARDVFKRALATNTLNQELSAFVRSRLAQLPE